MTTDDELREVLSTIENSLIENSLHLEDGGIVTTDDELREVLSTIENSLIENSLHLEDGGAREAPHARGEEPTDCNLGQSRR